MTKTMSESNLPKLVTSLPGPNAARVVAQDHEFVSGSYTRSYPLVARRGRGALIEDVDGNTFLDFSAGIAVVSTGHCHPEVVAAIQNQAAELIHMSGTDFYYENMVQLAKKLSAIAPGGEAKRVYFGNSGTEAMEAAIKLARYHTRREKIIAFYGCFHGRTMGSLSLTASKAVQRAGFGTLLAGVFHVPYPNPYRCPYGILLYRMRAVYRARTLQAHREARRGRRHRGRAHPGRGRLPSRARRILDGSATHLPPLRHHAGRR